MNTKNDNRIVSHPTCFWLRNLFADDRQVVVVVSILWPHSVASPFIDYSVGVVVLLFSFVARIMWQATRLVFLFCPSSKFLFRLFALLNSHSLWRCRSNPLLHWCVEIVWWCSTLTRQTLAACRCRIQIRSQTMELHALTSNCIYANAFFLIENNFFLILTRN